ncbi:monosaccharide ABC transporter substrate-binding protein (CUT2 family) [Motilibacter rhizosphaerae]|uniref:Monosaccharide ABC transporter substrate-binding protein (CUT2 family) n=1 Tax=Motilibacter rhizosphaerae TaxID=598652 RepID=A0A4Q7NVQ2_9ACTN|nr:rhamnose ABC transporter substrate-binding protein [Motilibacter rhizosphaerae]RZS91060.1 monosaccharide ABC transporter substrate-binding protein (CUT2 family) [Motilibacter rhizosphaerae]
MLASRRRLRVITTAVALSCSVAGLSACGSRADSGSSASSGSGGSAAAAPAGSAAASTDTGSSAASSGGSSAAASTGSDASGSAAAGGTTADYKTGLKIAFLPKQVNNPYFTVADGGGKAAVAELKGTYKETGPSDASASSQVSYINTLSQQGENVIATSANDPNAICGALKQAKSAGAKIVTYDSDTTPSCRDVFINQATPQGLADVEIKMMSDEIGGKGKIAILSATPNATNQNAWIALMKADLKKPENSGMQLVTVAYGNDDDQTSFQKTQGLLQSYPDLKGIISPTTVGIAAAARYLSGSKYKGKVQLTGLGTPNQMRQFVKDGTVKEFALWDPAQLGYLAAYAGAALASGTITGKQGESFSAGKLGSRTIGADGVVILGPPTVFQASNIDQFKF